jgi:poly-gamma-glutamate system protein
MLTFPSRLSCCAGVLGGVVLLGGAPTGHAGAPPRAEVSTRECALGARAAGLMERSLASIRRLRAARGVPVDPAVDPNGTGVIGAEFTPLTTSLGEVEAKRTSANPAFAAVMVDYFERAGLAPGDVVAVGASGSFPALILATLCAARVLDLRPIVIYSIGASMYGANLPGLTFVDMLAQVRSDGLLPDRIAAVSPGGDGDAGRGVLFDETGDTLLAETRRSGLPVVRGASLADRIADRLRVYDEARSGRPVRCFVNVGGSSASFGETEASLSLPNGLVLRVPVLPASPVRGLVFEFAARGVPVVHLLNVRGLARENNVPFDPLPLPPVGRGEGCRGR